MKGTEQNDQIQISEVLIDNESYFKISNNNKMRPFFMSIVSYSNHWMFISSNGGLTAGRKDSENSLFPYYTDDKITESSEITGSKSIFRLTIDNKSHLWEPFSIRNEGIYLISRNLYKNKIGSKIIFEEINHDLNLTFRYQWSSSDRYGFVKKSEIFNNAKVEVEVSILDGIQNILPYGVDSFLQNQSSNLVDAYKRNQLDADSGLGIFALSAIIVDKAEPSEALKANLAWSIGLKEPKYLLSSLQLKDFRAGKNLSTEEDIKAEKGAFFVQSDLKLGANSSEKWMIVADVNKNHAAVAALIHQLKNDDALIQKVDADIALGVQKLIHLNAASDALQLTADKLRDARHFSNVLFNIMRGGIFDDNYSVEKWDFNNYLRKANHKVHVAAFETIDLLPAKFNYADLVKIARDSDDANLKRLIYEYLPLKFSRRHGDPSRPWNKFSINTRNEEDGSKILDYEGNWRDIFQNWEALAHSYPGFIVSMIHKFLNASTFEGYNPYRITKDGFDWEAIEADDPWSYIGYWGDHQVIYLLKLLEFAQDYDPACLKAFFNQHIFVYANVPYRIKDYQSILENPKDTIDFDHDLDQKIRLKREELGADGALLSSVKDPIYKVNFIEKILAMLLSKLSNFVPEGGIWMNTQRPEWNDANNALVGNGVSMVTLYYMRRFLEFFNKILESEKNQKVEVSKELLDLYQTISEAFLSKKELLLGPITDQNRKSILDIIGKSASDYRNSIYDRSFSGVKDHLQIRDLSNFILICQQILEKSIDSNKRSDDLYHAYNLITIENDKEASISYLSEMLEGQVAVLSAGYLSPDQSLEVLNALKSSSLFRPDQYSYILYPNKNLPTFFQKNIIPPEAVSESPLLQTLVENGDSSIINKDINGTYHFNGNFKNAGDLKNALEELSDGKYAALVTQDKQAVLQIFEDLFDHKSFTGRSGTFYGYEGLGSIYWHMVSKLQLAVQECCLRAIAEGADEVIIGGLLDHYYEINAGIGVHKSPDLYGAFPTDPYSHTPFSKGAQQPGMTGQVKEDILIRFGELGISIQEGQLTFAPTLLKKDEFLTSATNFEYVNVSGEAKQVSLKEDTICFTYCQVPVIYEISDSKGIQVYHNNGSFTDFESNKLDRESSQHIFNRSKDVELIKVQLLLSDLR